MTSWKVWRLVILLTLIGVFAWTLYTRGIPGRFGEQPMATLQTDYRTEREWAIRDTALDIEEMAAFADRRQPRPLPATLPETPWDVGAFVALAKSSLGDAVAITAVDVTAIDLYPALTAQDVPALVDASKTVSEMLTANMRNPRAHESAALVVGAFALRDAADVFTDVRWALNRMTAHLAAARALRADETRSPDGALAEVVLLALANHQARAITGLASLGSGSPPEPMNAWVRALTLRITQDWRALAKPSEATRLEKLEYFRARRATLRRQRAAEHLAMVGEPAAADFTRIAQDTINGVEDGHEFIMPALELELDEARLAYRRLHGRQMPESLPEALNVRATRVIADGPQVLPWGAWAEFYQRQIAMNMGMVDSFIRHWLDNDEDADRAKRDFAARFGTLTLFPLGTQRWTKGSEGTEADQQYIQEAIELAAKAPELVTAPSWQWWENGARYELIPTRMPASASWFAPPTPQMPYQAGLRRADGSAEHRDALVDAAPYDVTLLIAYSSAGSPDPALTRARGLLGQRHDYDVGALTASATHIDGEAGRIPLRRKACEMSTRECLILASGLLYYVGDEAGAAEAYQRAFTDPLVDAVTRAADSYWLSTYYYRNGETEKAMAIAEAAAQTGSGTGRYSRGRLYERMGDFDRAERDFAANAEQYNAPEGLVSFYYRRAEIDRHPAYTAKWERWRAETFPNGMQPAPTSLTGIPTNGVFINKDSELSRKEGIRVGDIVVGLEGWKVENVDQYQAVNLFHDNPVVKLTISRGGRLTQVEAKSPTRMFGTYLETHPMKGWIKD